MAAPPGALLPSASTGTTNSDNPQKPLAEELLRMARACPQVADLNIGQSKLSRIVRGFLLHSGCHTLEDVRDSRPAPAAFIEWVIAYADPTGETAVRNVMREQRRRAA